MGEFTAAAPERQQEMRQAHRLRLPARMTADTLPMQSAWTAVDAEPDQPSITCR